MAGSDRSRLLLTSAQLRRLAGDAAPLRDADPRLEIRSNRRGETGFGRANLSHLLELAEGPAAGLHFAKSVRRVSLQGLKAVDDAPSQLL